MPHHHCSTLYTGSLGPQLEDICSAPSFLVFMSYLHCLILNDRSISGACERVKPIVTPVDEYDFIVIGGGAGGAVAAARLSENPSWRVLLLEAGPDEPAGAAIPGFYGLFMGSKLSWQYKTTNEKNACLAFNGSCVNRAGKNLGGNTMHNGMAYLRGNPKDYENWAAMGNHGWRWEDVKPFFLKAENNREIDRVGRFYHATGGPLPVQRFPYTPPFGDSIIAAGQEAGYPVSEDLNGKDRVGYSKIQCTNFNGVRSSSASAYLRPVRNRKNLDISLESMVTKIITHNNRAVGVEYLKDSKSYRVKARREVIVSGGAVGSPRILLNSGIGPRKNLDSVGIKVVKDIPGVGENFHNHVTFGLAFTIDEPDLYDNNWEVAKEYVGSRSGPLCGRGLSVTANLASSKSTPDYADIQIYHAGYGPNCAPGGVGALKSNGKRTISMIATYTHVRSKGRVTLASNDPQQPPVIFGNFFSDPNDIEAVIEGLNMILKVAKTNTLKSYNLTLLNVPIAPCSHLEFLSKEYFTCAIPQVGQPDNHQAGTCKMGPVTDPLAVVDPRLRVYGMKGLRVADASVMPQVTSANTASPTIMIGERVAHFIKEEWGFKDPFMNNLVFQ